MDKSMGKKSKIKMTRQMPKLFIFGVVGVLVLLFVLAVPTLVYADDGHTENVPHNETSQLPVLPIEEDDDFVGDRHADHTHAITAKEPWYQDGQWWIFFIISLFLIALFSFGVYRYLQVKD